MNTKTLAQQIAAIEFALRGRVLNEQHCAAMRATLALLTRLRDAEQAQPQRAPVTRERGPGRGGMDTSFDY